MTDRPIASRSCTNVRLRNDPARSVILGSCFLRNSVAKYLLMATEKSNTPMRFGYARVSKSGDQQTAPQIRALKEAGCKKIFEESASGGRWDRPELHRLLGQLREGDTLVVWKLDRLSRSLKDLLMILDQVEAVGAKFCSLTEAVDTSGPAGRMVMQMLGAFAEFEREMIRERTKAGLTEARAKGRMPGRKPRLTTTQQEEVVDAVTSGRKTAADMARLFNIHPSTISRLVARARAF